jgi:hypothetical protein
MVKTLGIEGLLVSLAGVLLPFRYGMPFRIPSSGGSFIVTEQVDPSEVKTDALYTALGYLGLAAVVVGTACQIAAVALAR